MPRMPSLGWGKKNFMFLSKIHFFLGVKAGHDGRGRHVVCVGKHLKVWGTDLEGQTFEFITAYDTLASMGQELKSSMSSEVLVICSPPEWKRMGTRMICQYGDMSCRVG